jgi:hypothetical protein
MNEEISKKENLEFFNKDISLLEESYKNKYYLGPILKIYLIYIFIYIIT